MPVTLRDEIRQKRPFGSLEQEAYLNIVRTAIALDDDLDEVMRLAGITLPQYNVLRILRGAEPTGLCRGELGDRMLTRMPDVTRLLDRMEKAGLVRRARETTDRRQVRTHITPEGRRLLAVHDDAVYEAHAHQLGHLPTGELRTLIALLTKVRHPA